MVKPRDHSRGPWTIREKEQFSHCLNLLYADGRTAVLTNDSPSGETEEKAAEIETSGQGVPPEAYSGIAKVPPGGGAR
jgi:hypothetical protein